MDLMDLITFAEQSAYFASYADRVNNIVSISIGTWTTSTGGTAGDGLFILFGSMLYDAATGLYLTKTRAYNPVTGGAS